MEQRARKKKGKKKKKKNPNFLFFFFPCFFLPLCSIALWESMKTIKAQMPFSWLGAHPDTGSEFINRMVMDWCREGKIELSRSRPNHKNDNMFVEERNGHVIRKTIGYITLDCREAVGALNLLYDVLTPY